jgi:hypothetical protein
VRHLNSIAAHADVLRPFVCSSAHGSLDSKWVHVDRVFALAGNGDEVEIGELEPLERCDAPLLRIAEEALVP